MLWSKLQKQLYNIIDPTANFEIHCSVFKTKSAWTAGQRSGVSNKKEAVPRYWITVDKQIIWDFPAMFLDEYGLGYCDGETIRTYYMDSENYTWIADVIRGYIDTPKAELLTVMFEKDKFGLVDVFRKYDRRISKNKRNEMRLIGSNTTKLKEILEKEKRDEDLGFWCISLSYQKLDKQLPFVLYGCSAGPVKELIEVPRVRGFTYIHENGQRYIDEDNMFYISIEKYPKLLVGNCLLSHEELCKALCIVRLNVDVLLRHWNEEVDDMELVNMLVYDDFVEEYRC